MKIAKPMRGKNNLVVIACALTLLLTGCQSNQSSSSSSSTSTPSPSTPSSQSTPQPSSTASSSSPQSQSSQSQPSQNQSSQNQAEQQNSGDPELGGEETAYDEDGGEIDSNEETSPEIFGGSKETSGGDILSQEESVAILDEQLDESMAVFDGMIIDERTAAKANESKFPDDEGSVFGDDNPLFEEADIAENSDGPAGATSEEAEDSGGGVYSDNGSENGRETVSSRNGGVNTSKGGSQVPSDIPNGSDDDIVARQIREAAIKEQDPVLREKLWEEYRKYKQGQ